MTPSPPVGTVRWESEAFRDELRAFVAGAVGEPRVLEPVRVRPWSTVWRAETASGTFYAKENCPGQSHEAALLLRLGEIAPDLVVPVVAADLATGLLLTPDQGDPVGDVHDVATWCRIVGAAADLQRRVADSGDPRLGLTAMPPQDAAPYVERLLGELGALPAGDPRRLGDDEAGAVRRRVPGVARAAERVAALGLPLTLNHNDLHGENVFATGGRMVFFDLGDAVLAEPLAMLRIPLNVLAEGLGADVDDPRLRRVADVALERWSDVVPLAELRAALPAALHLARLARVESWRRCIATMEGEELAEFGGAAARWLATLASDTLDGAPA